MKSKVIKEKNESSILRGLITFIISSSILAAIILGITYLIFKYV